MQANAWMGYAVLVSSHLPALSDARAALSFTGAGTWFLGRDGWCDGQAVRPWVIDVTGQLLPPPAVNNVTYVGLFQGATPAPSVPGAIIIMQSFVSLYGLPGLDISGHRPDN
jgi:hypothetical protein